MARECLGKQSYPGRQAAQRVLKAMLRRDNFRPARNGTHAYHCPACGSWHVGRSA